MMQSLAASRTCRLCGRYLRRSGLLFSSRVPDRTLYSVTRVWQNNKYPNNSYGHVSSPPGISPVPCRSLYSVTGSWPETYTKDTRRALESHWREPLRERDARTSQPEEGQQKYYVLSMFPYPSGKLHMGHVRVYTISDVMARYHRLTGKHVVHPMGWDGFGLPAENAAIERGEQPDKWTYSNIATMKHQIEELCCSFDWDSEFATCDPEYYRWTQHIFLQLYHAGLVTQKLGAVNWDPVDQTVVADEQIDENGRSWRSGATVERRFIRQWYIKTTAYSKSLIDGLSEVNSDLWKDILDLQRHWIGSCDGVRLELKVKAGDGDLTDRVSIFTRQPQCVYGASHVLLAPHHYLNDTQYHKCKHLINGKEVTELSITAHNALSDSDLPVYVSDHWEHSDTVDAHLGLPDVSREDRQFAEQRSLSYTAVIDERTDSIINSQQLTGLSQEEAFHKVTELAKEIGCGGHVTSDKARDWLISRQRYWGTPIPIVHCDKYGAVPVPYEDLPVTLPEVTTLTGKGQSPLESAEDWVKVKCAKCDCDGYGRRETDTMDTFVDSSWYFLRYLDSRNQRQPFSPDNAARYMPVDLYIGGKEHATMHLYYARFLHHFLYDAGAVPQREPFVNLLAQGMVMGRSYQVTGAGRYIRQDQVDFTGATPVERATGAAVTEGWEKMSKSKHNGVDPQDVLAEFGCDATRLCILSNVAPKSDRNWSNDVYQGVQRWQSRVWSLVSQLRVERDSDTDRPSDAEIQKCDEEIAEIRNYFVKQVSHHLGSTFLLSVAVSRLQGLTNALKKVPSGSLAYSPQCERALADLIVMLAPFSPLFCAELWEGLRTAEGHVCRGFDWDREVWAQKWPEVDDDYRLSLKVKVDGRERCQVRLPMPPDKTSTLTKLDALALIAGCPQASQALQGVDLTPAALFIDPGVRVELTVKTKKKKKKNKKKE